MNPPFNPSKFLRVDWWWIRQAENSGTRCQRADEGIEGVICGRSIYSGELDFSAAQARAIGVLLTMVTGLPLTPITRAIGWEIDVETGRARKPTGPVDYVRGLVVGR